MNEHNAIHSHTTKVGRYVFPLSNERLVGGTGAILNEPNMLWSRTFEADESKLLIDRSRRETYSSLTVAYLNNDNSCDRIHSQTLHTQSSASTLKLILHMLHVVASTSLTIKSGLLPTYQLQNTN